MLKLNTHLPLEVIKQSKALQGIYNKKRSEIIRNNINYYHEDFNITISDVIENAEFLFDDTRIRTIAGCFIDERYEYWVVQNEILSMCQQDKTIQEVSDYIIKNLK